VEGGIQVLNYTDHKTTHGRPRLGELIFSRTASKKQNPILLEENGVRSFLKTMYPPSTQRDEGLQVIEC
jgi:hypothetical protein